MTCVCPCQQTALSNRDNKLESFYSSEDCPYFQTSSAHDIIGRTWDEALNPRRGLPSLPNVQEGIPFKGLDTFVIDGNVQERPTTQLYATNPQWYRQGSEGDPKRKTISSEQALQVIVFGRAELATKFQRKQKPTHKHFSNETHLIPSPGGGLDGMSATQWFPVRGAD